MPKIRFIDFQVTYQSCSSEISHIKFVLHILPPQFRLFCVGNSIVFAIYSPHVLKIFFVFLVKQLKVVALVTGMAAGVRNFWRNLALSHTQTLSLVEEVRKKHFCLFYKYFIFFI